MVVNIITIIVAVTTTFNTSAVPVCARDCTIPDKLFYGYRLNWFICRGRNPANTMLKENRVGRLMLPHFETYYRATVVKIVWYW